MKDKKIVIAGGTGFIGEELSRYFENENEITILTRQLNNSANNRNNQTILSERELSKIKYIKWDGTHLDNWIKELEHADILINLAGKSVNCRYTEKNKKEILISRINATKVIGEAIKNCINPPKLWINASSATIYPHAEIKPNDEYTFDLKNDFSVQVCKQWEKVFNEFETPHTRKVIFRMAITLGSGGVLKPYFNLLKFGLGGQQGSGKQMYSWIHIEDTCRIIEWIHEHENLSGTYNCSSPNAVSNKEFMRTLRNVTGHRFGLPAFEWMLKTGALLIGTETELVLKSRWVIPTKLMKSGFQFKYPELSFALKNIISKVPRKQYHLF